MSNNLYFIDKLRKMPNAHHRLIELILAEYEPRRRRIARAIEKDCGIGTEEISSLTVALKVMHTQSKKRPMSDVIEEILKGENKKWTTTTQSLST